MILLNNTHFYSGVARKFGNDFYDSSTPVQQEFLDTLIVAVGAIIVITFLVCAWCYWYYLKPSNRSDSDNEHLEDDTETSSINNTVADKNNG